MVGVFCADAQEVDRNAPDFVKASVLAVGPGEELFSCVGHAAVRLVCPAHELDYCFSYESEKVSDRLGAFFAGGLKMGMFATKTAEFLDEYREDGRGVKEYPLELPPAAKTRLWKILDDLAMKGAELPYDYIKRGCAKSVHDAIKSAIGADVEESPLPLTQREVFRGELKAAYPWNLFFLNAIVGVETDTFAEVVTPKNLLGWLRLAMVDGKPIVAGEGRELLPRTLPDGASVFTPMSASVALLALVVGFAVLRRTGRGVFAAEIFFRLMLACQFAAGVFFVYLMTASKLPTAAWNWLVVPFNPVMPILAGLAHFRRGVFAARVLPCVFAAVIALWAGFMIFAPHALTDPAWIVTALAYAVIYFEKGGKR